MPALAPLSDLTRLFSPRSIVVVGASEEPRRIGGQPVVALTRFGYAGELHLVNPKRTSIHGRPCHPELAAVPGRCDVALIAVPAEQVPGVIEQCGAAGIPFAIVLSAGFREIGDTALEARLAAAIAASGVRVLGPNCTGLLNLRERVFSGFGAGFRNPDLKAGPVAMVSQSGGFGYSVVAFAQAHGLGFDYVVSSGNETDVDSTELLAHLVERPEVEIVVSYLEGITRGDRLRAVGRRALELGKPILVWKVGNSAVGREAAASHTANLTARYDYYREAFREGGFVEVHEMYDVVDCAHAFLQRKLPHGRSIALLTTSGGAGVLLADDCAARGLELPQTEPRTLATLQALVPGFAALANPIDLSAALAQNAEAFNAATRAVVEDPGMDQVLLRSFPGAAIEVWAQGLAQIAAGTDKPLLVSVSGLRSALAPVLPVLEAAGIPAYDTPRRAVTAAAALASFAEKLRRRRPAPARTVERRELPLPAGRRTLSEHESAQCLAAYGIPTVRSLRLAAAQVEAAAGLALRFPVAVKVDSPDIAHKTECGAVRLGVADPVALRAATAEVLQAAAAHAPQARIDGVLVQEMAGGLEVIAGALVDPWFGPVVVFGAGGILAEVAADKAMRFAPFDEATAREMIAETRVARLLDGYRGSPARDLDALAQTLVRLSWLIADHADVVREIDVNPLFVGAAGQGVVAADALVVPT